MSTNIDSPLSFVRALLAAATLVPSVLLGEPVSSGLWKTVVDEVPSDKPIVFGGWSRAEAAEASEYCVLVDVTYSDGSHDWARKAHFRMGTHGWEEARGVILPKKPVKGISVYAIFRSRTEVPASGVVLFRDFFLERRDCDGEAFPLLRLTDRPFSNTDELTVDIVDGRRVRREVRRLPLPDAPASPIASGTVRVWTEDSMRLVTPLTFPDAATTADIRLSLAGRERESAQILLSAAADVEWKAVTLEMPQLVSNEGTPFKGSVTWQRQGYLKREFGAARHPYSFPAHEKWFPDPLLPPAPMRVRPASTQGAWLTVFADPLARPGAYAGEVIVREQGVERARIPLHVTVEPFCLPKTFGLRTAYSLMDGPLRAVYPDQFSRKKREAIDIMLDHRLNPDDISRTTPPEIADLLHARSRGMNSFNILNIVPPPTDTKSRMVLYASPEAIFSESFYSYFVGVVKPYVAELKKFGLDGMAYVYGFDERGEEYYLGMNDFWRRFRQDVPGIPLMNTARIYRDFAQGKTNAVNLLSGDWYCPHTHEYNLKVSDRLRALGKQVWWYTCCYPQYPYANFASWEYPPIEGRILGWMTWRMRADGFLFWIVNKWRGEKRFAEDDTYFPDYGTYNSNAYMPGDGIMLYPGERNIFTSIKLAQCRDAVEDYEYLQLLAAKRGRAVADSVTDTIMKSMTEYTRSPEAIRAARARVAQLIAEDVSKQLQVGARAKGNER